MGVRTRRLEQALKNWQEKLADYEYELSITSSPNQKFELKKRIEEVENQIMRLEERLDREFSIKTSIPQPKKTQKSQIQIFLSHASEDKEEVLKLYDRLRARGYKLWLDIQDILPGQNWREAISRAIRESNIFIICFSSKSVGKQGYVQKELKLGMERYAEMPPGTIYLIPLRLDECEIPNLQRSEYGINLKELQWLDYWKPDSFENLEKAIELQFGSFEAPLEPERLDDILIRQFLEQAGAKTRPQEKLLQVTSILGKLNSYTPFPVMFIEQPNDKHVIELQQKAEQLGGTQQPQIGLIVYAEHPDPLFRIRMTEVRLRDHFVIIPIPLAAVEQALVDETTSTGLLAQYAVRYLPGADLFDDRNAIGDTLSFYGRNTLLHHIEKDLDRCQGIGLFGIRKSGKTSVLLQLGFSMRQHPIVYLDLQPYGGKLRYGTELFNEILQKLSNLLNKNTEQAILRFDPFKREHPAKKIATTFIQLFCECTDALKKANYKLPIICLVDEIERIFPTPTDSRERVEEFNTFFGALRELSQTRRSLSLLVADVHPDCNRLNHWTQPDVPTNPVFQFFKEVFVYSFPQEETETMLNEIGQLMGVQFEPELLATIHLESGGHPFIARQIASLLCKKADKEKQNRLELITNTVAEQYLKRSFKYSGVLKSYFQENIWADLDKRNCTVAMAILRLLACNEALAERVLEEALLARLNGKLSESECESALLWLVNVGLIRREEIEKEDYYSLQIRLMSRWLQREMTKEEILQWQIHYVISNLL